MGPTYRQMEQRQTPQCAASIDPLSDCQPGDVVLFGRYPQNSPEPESIEWLVLAQDRSTVQLISRFSLAIREYDRTGGEWTAWRRSRLRTWLNGEFVQVAFNARERMRLVTNDVPANPSDVQQTSFDPKFRTRDRVYVLNKGEAQRFFPTRESRICELVPKARRGNGGSRLWTPVQVGDEVVYKEVRGGPDYVWWLCSWSGWSNDVVDWDGSFRKHNFECRFSVRPVVRVRRAEGLEACRLMFQECQPGDFVTFGTYPGGCTVCASASTAHSGSNTADSGANAEPAPIEWQVLSRGGPAVRLISRFVLDAASWHHVIEAAGWEASDLRTWLSSQFLSAAFSDKEQEWLEEADPHLADKVTLLNELELRRFFSAGKQSLCQPTEYASQHGSVPRRSGGACWWWLRCAGKDPFCAMGVNDRGRVVRAGRHMRAPGGIRPVIVVRASPQ